MILSMRTNNGVLLENDTVFPQNSVIRVELPLEGSRRPLYDRNCTIGALRGHYRAGRAAACKTERRYRGE